MGSSEQMGLNELKRALEERNEIVWLEDPSKFDYLRVSTVHFGSRRPPSEKGLRRRIGDFYKLVGYGLAHRGSPGLFFRNIYWLKTYDRGCPKEAECYGRPDSRVMPAEAVETKHLILGGAA